MPYAEKSNVDAHSEIVSPGIRFGSSVKMTKRVCRTQVLYAGAVCASNNVMLRISSTLKTRYSSHPVRRTAGYRHRFACIGLLILVAEPGSIFAQSFLSSDKAARSVFQPKVELAVPKGAPIRVSLKKSVTISKIGQAIQAYLTDSIYVFDRVVIPKGSEVDGRIVALTGPSAGRRVGYYLNGDFSPHRTARIVFDTLILPSGLQIPLQTQTVPEIGTVLKLEANPQGASLASRGRNLISSQLHLAISEVKPSALLRHAKSVLWSEWPYHRQKFAAGTVFVADLEQPLDFGPAKIPRSEEGAIGQLPSTNALAFARLTTGLSSAVSAPGAPVDAELTRPVFSSDHKLLLPAGTELQGIVVSSKPARRLHRNGRLLFRLDTVKLPSSVSQPVEMALQGLEVPESSHLRMDSEGETRVADNKESRVLRTAFSAAIATSTFDSDSGHAGATATSENRPVGGLSGYKLIGLAIAFSARSPVLSRTFGLWGTAQSAYLHFLARGQNLVLPKNTPIEISFGERVKHRGQSRAKSSGY